MQFIDWIRQNFPDLLVPFLVVALGATAITAPHVNWSRLAANFPNNNEEPLLQLRWQFGMFRMMEPIHGIWKRLGFVRGSWGRYGLILSVCPSGLRVGITWWLHPFSRDFFVPWEALRVTRVFGQSAELQFGHPVIGTLGISGRVADQLAGAAQGRWPETGLLLPQP